MASAQCAYQVSCRPDYEASYEACLNGWLPQLDTEPDCYDGCAAAACVDAYGAAADLCRAEGAVEGDPEVDAVLDPCLEDAPWTGPGCVQP